MIMLLLFYYGPVAWIGWNKFDLIQFDTLKQ